MAQSRVKLDQGENQIIVNPPRISFRLPDSVVDDDGEERGPQIEFFPETGYTTTDDNEREKETERCLSGLGRVCGRKSMEWLSRKG